MPFKNEHSCRIEDPAQYANFSRDNERKIGGKPVSFVYGITEDGSELQSVRFPVGSWSESEATRVCTELRGTFEPADPSAELSDSTPDILRLSSSIELDAGDSPPEYIHLLSTGVYYVDKYDRDIILTRGILAAMVENREAEYSNQILIDEAHLNQRGKEERALGWGSALELRNDGTELWMSVDHWTPDTIPRIMDKELRYTSAAFNLHHLSQHNGGKDIGPMLYSAGLTNIPALFSQYPLVATETETDIDRLQDGATNFKSERVMPKQHEKFISLSEISPSREVESAIETLFTSIGVKEGGALLSAYEKLRVDAEKVTELQKSLDETRVLLTAAEAKLVDALAKPGDVSKSEIELAQRVNELENMQLSDKVNHMLDEAQAKGLLTKTTRETYHKVGMAPEGGLVNLTELLAKKSPEVPVNELGGGEELPTMELTAGELKVASDMNIDPEAMLAEKIRRSKIKGGV